MSNQRITIRIDALIDGKFDNFAIVPDDPMFGRPVPHSAIRARFDCDRTYRLFVGRTHRRWLKWIVKSKMSDSDKIFLSGVLYATLGDDP
jgi:hypothetical protein